MEYQIRYRDSKESGESTVVVEANSPTEALVKFRHTRSHGHGKTPVTASVTDDADMDIEPDSQAMPW